MSRADNQPSRDWVFDPDLHGSSRWADAAHLASRGYGPEGRHILGFLPPEQRGARSTPITYSGDRHELIVAPTRGGKGVSGVIPRLLDHPGSAIVVDVKDGELALITARYRQDVLGQNVHLIDPYNIVCSKLGIEPSKLNPMRSVDLDGDEPFDEAMLIAESCTIGENGGDSFWSDEAVALQSGFILREVERGGDLSDVRKLLNSDPDGFDTILDEMKTSPYQLVRAAGARLASKADRERSSVISTAQRNTHFLESHKLADSLSASDFDVSKIGTATTIYLILPARRIHTAKRWLRLLVSTLIYEITALQDKPAQPVMFVLDELAALDRLKIVEQSFGLMAGFGLQLVAVVQDFSQLRDVYGERWQTFVANAASIQCFGTNDEFTARYLSGLSGQTTSEKLSFESANIRASLFSDPEYRGQLDTLYSRPLITMDELMSMHPATQFMKLAAAHPVIAYRPVYYLDQCYRDNRGQPLFDIHPTRAEERLASPIDFEKSGDKLGEVLAKHLTVG